MIPHQADRMRTCEVLKAHPLGSKVFLSTEFIKSYCNVFNPRVKEILEAEWEVLDYYYVIGSRGDEMCGLVVGIPYLTWATLAPTRGFVIHTAYGNLGKARCFETDEDCHEILETKLKVNATRYKGKLCVMVVTHLSDIVPEPEIKAIDAWADIMED